MDVYEVSQYSPIYLFTGFEAFLISWHVICVQFITTDMLRWSGRQNYTSSCTVKHWSAYIICPPPPASSSYKWVGGGGHNTNSSCVSCLCLTAASLLAKSTFQLFSRCSIRESQSQAVRQILLPVTIFDCHEKSYEYVQWRVFARPWGRKFTLTVVFFSQRLWNLSNITIMITSTELHTSFSDPNLIQRVSQLCWKLQSAL